MRTKTTNLEVVTLHFILIIAWCCRYVSVISISTLLLLPSLLLVMMKVVQLPRGRSHTTADAFVAKAPLDVEETRSSPIINVPAPPAPPAAQTQLSMSLQPLQISAPSLNSSVCKPPTFAKHSKPQWANKSCWRSPRHSCLLSETSPSSRRQYLHLPEVLWKISRLTSGWVLLRHSHMLLTLLQR
jgi:hypothetical protein